MYITVGINGDILMVSNVPVQGITEYIGIIPNDFLDTFSLDKYVFLNNQIVQVQGWIAPIYKPLIF